jgi:hypothetical protein
MIGSLNTFKWLGFGNRALGLSIVTELRGTLGWLLHDGRLVLCCSNRPAKLGSYMAARRVGG